MRINIEKEVNLPKLQMELLAANLIEPTAYFGEQYFIAKDDADINLIQQIIDTHDSTPIQTVSSDEILKAKIETETINLLIDLGVI